MTVVLGLTGPIGCGKSTVASWLAARGAVVVDADRVARDVTAPGEPGHEAVLARFGDAARAADGTLDRAALAAIVFSEEAALSDLERIVHPLVRPRLLAAIEGARAAGAPAVAVEAIKLVEGGLAALCDTVWFVTCRDQRARLLGRGMGAGDADRRMAAQAGMEERFRAEVGVPTAMVDTTGTLAEAEARVSTLWSRLVG